MPEVTYTGGGHYRVGGYGFDPNDEKNVDDELASYLEDVDDFEVVGDSDDGGQEDEPPDDKSDTDEVEICGEEKSDGEICERNAGECPYHGEED